MRRSRPTFEFKPTNPVRRGNSDVPVVGTPPTKTPPDTRLGRRPADTPDGATPPNRKLRDAPPKSNVTKLKTKPDKGDGKYGGDKHGNGRGHHDKGKHGIIYCHCCGLPWWNCCCCHHWKPLFWWYYGCYTNYWDYHWYPRTWVAYYSDNHYYGDSYSNIYSPPAQALDPTSLAIELLDEGVELFRSGAYLEAMYKFYQAVQVDPDFAIPRFAYAHALFALGLYEYAAYEIRYGMYLLPEWLEMGGDIKLLYGNTTDFEQQMTALFTHLKVWQDDEDAILVLGYVSFFSGDLYTAERVFEYLSFSLMDDNKYVADLFRDTIEIIKNEIAAADPASALLKDDGITLSDLLKN